MMLQKLSSMKQLANLAIATAITAVSLVFFSQGALAQVVLVDDFESYTVDTSINAQGGWEAQANVSETTDSENSNVVLRDGDQALQLVNRDEIHPGDSLQTVYTSMALPTAISTGTIYMRWMKSSEGANEAGDPASPVRGDMIFSTNGLLTGFDPDEDGFITDFGPGTGGQQATNYSQQAAIMGMYATAGGTQFHARDDGSYKDVDTPFAGNLVHDQWYEMWVQVDQTANQQTRYYLAEEGETPQIVMNGASEWWGNRDDSYSDVTAIKFFNGINALTEVSIYIDTIGLDLTGWSTNSLLDGAAGIAGDYNSNGTVDAADYTVWRDGGSPDSTIAGYDLWVANFGSTSSSATATSVPEPSTLLSICAGGLFCLVTRRRSTNN